jgi:hypothetical protein
MEWEFYKKFWIKYFNYFLQQSRRGKERDWVIIGLGYY